MKILISTTEKISDPNTGEELGVRACDITDTPFEVHEDLIWVNCPDGVSGDTHCYNMNTQEFVVIPEVVPTITSPRVTGAENL